MMDRRLVPLVIAAAVAAGCVDNTAPGNDREAQLEPAAPAAELASASAALNGVATGLLYAQIMTEPDLQRLPELGDACTFRYTRVGFPVFVYGSGTGFIKLNGKLVPLPAGGEGAWAEGGVSVTVRPLDDADLNEAGPFAAEFVLRFADAPNELGFHGFSEC